MLPECSYSWKYFSTDSHFLKNRYVSFNFYEKWLNFQNWFQMLSNFLVLHCSVNNYCKLFYVFGQLFLNMMCTKFTKGTFPNHGSQRSSVRDCLE